MGADGRVNERIENYTKFWEKDSAKDTETERENRLTSYTDVVNGMSYTLLLYPSLNKPRLLRRCHRTLRVWLGTVFPLLSLL